MKKINYPTQEYIDSWIDNYLEKHPNEKITDFEELAQKAQDAWWLNEIEHDRPTPDDLTEEQEKASKEARKGMAKSEKTRKPSTRTRKPNETKRTIMAWCKALFEGFALNRQIESCLLTNEERTLEIFMDGKHYTLTLTEHREKKG